AGPFPCLPAATPPGWLFVSPADLGSSPDTSEIMRINGPISHGAPFCDSRTTPVSRSDPPSVPAYAWGTKQMIEDYLRGTPVSPNHWRQSKEFCIIERIARPNGLRGKSLIPDPNAPNRFCLRLTDHACLGAYASMPLKEASYREGFDLLPATEGLAFRMGGGGHVVRMSRHSPDRLDAWLPLSQPVSGTRAKWLLLSPAIFPRASSSQNKSDRPHPGGWLPTWVDPDSGQVLLRRGKTERGSKSREEWRRRIRELPFLDCRLMGAAVRPLISIGGWSERKHLRIDDPKAQPGPRTVWTAVPAGSVYYFEGPDAPWLGQALAWHGQEQESPQEILHRRSTLLGEQGFGLGVCGPW
ncbi:MAG TPA: type III-B CRISPR module-associated Cmr3 family protein, partial [Verrucomicrobiota bacterium]|nr:type III-B CRISPR module-associated Cmr3 family protein [Verrucomicrobiota bacterium]